VEALSSLFQPLVNAWRTVPPGTVEYYVLRAVIIGGGLFVVIASIELVHRVGARHYGWRGLAPDLGYWFYYRTGLHYFIFLAFIYGLMSAWLEPYNLRLLEGLPFVLQVVLYMACVDLIVYWIHRAQHTVPFLWAFHSVHHSQEHLNFLTSQRVHPGDRIFQDLLMFVPIKMLGFDENAWIPLYLWGEFNLAAQHSRIPWRYGPLYPVIVSPVFHSFHHSADPRHHDCNYSGFFSFWDYLFGTAVRRHEPAPQRFGLQEPVANTFVGTLAAPFERLRGADVRN
jgi:sterol desaturase/sphingolipid hydroxylase (fatty acid hydroxylase superfamily)